MMYAFPLQVLITVVDRGKGDKMARLYERAGVKTQLMCLGFGTAKSEILEYLGLGDLEKEILFSAAPRAAIQTGLEKLRGELPFSRPGGGVACSVTFSSVSMAALRHIQKEATIIETGEAEKMDENITYMLAGCDRNSFIDIFMGKCVVFKDRGKNCFTCYHDSAFGNVCP